MGDHLFFEITTKELSIIDINSIFEKKLHLKLSEEVVEKVVSNRAYLEKKINASDALHYGINTGFGSLCNEVISSTQLKELQINLVKSHACGFGGEIDEELVKMMLLLKVQSLTRGFSGVKITTIERLIYFFNNNILPVVFEQGSLGASGDLAPLAHVALALIGDGKVNFKNTKINSIDVHKELNIEPIELDSKEGLALLNGTQFMSAYAVHAALRCGKIFNQSNSISALSLDAFNCDLSPFNYNVHLLRPFKGQQYISEKIRQLLSGSDLEKVKDKDVQDPYSFRCIPQVHGASYDVYLDFIKKVEIEINAVTDNPIIIEEDDKIISAGNFHGQPLAYAMDFIGIAMAEMGAISERRIYKMISGSRGLPPFLVKNPGLNSGFMIPQYTAASIVSKNKMLSHPASVDSIESSNGQEDHVSMGSISGVKLKEILENVQRILSIELLVAAQAFGFRKPRKSSEIIMKLYETYTSEVPFIEEDVILHELMIKSEKFLKKEFD